MKLILVPTDMSETASHALRYASAVAERLDAHLLAIYADPFMPPVDVSGAAAFSIHRDELIESAREQLQAHVEENVSEHVPFDTRVVPSSPVDAIINQACETGADLIIMGTHGRSGIRRLIVGSVAEAVIRLASVPVIAVNAAATESPAMKRVFCPVSFTSPSLEALRYAATLAENSSLLLLRGLEASEVRKSIDEVIALQDWVPRELLGRAEMQVMPNAVTPEQMVDYARSSGADLIAIGVPAEHNVMETMLHLSPCPVLTMNEATVRRTVPDRKLPLTAMALAG